jgi:organic hydroperoxide reductase OsmC/OhrA
MPQIERSECVEDSHEYRIVAWWASGRTGLAKSDSAPNTIHFAAPMQFGGLAGRWTPEDLLLCAIASCFTTTFRVLAEYSRWEYVDLQVEATGKVDKADSGYSFSHVILRPHLKVLAEPDCERGLHLLRKAESLCLVSRALAVAQAFEPVVEVSDTAHAAHRS